MRVNRTTATRIAAAVLPAALAVTLVPATHAQSSLPGGLSSQLSSRSGISDGLRPHDPPQRTPIEVETTRRFRACPKA